MTQGSHRRSGVLVQHADRHRLALRRCAGVLADQDSRVEVVRREEGIRGALRNGRRVQGDHDDACLPRLRDRSVLGLAVRDRNQDPLHAGGRHVLDRRNLACVVGAALSGRVHKGCAESLRRLRRPGVHLDEERVGGVLRDQPDLDVRAL